MNQDTAATNVARLPRSQLVGLAFSHKAVFNLQLDRISLVRTLFSRDLLSPTGGGSRCNRGGGHAGSLRFATDTGSIFIPSLGRLRQPNLRAENLANLLLRSQRPTERRCNSICFFWRCDGVHS